MTAAPDHMATILIVEDDPKQLKLYGKALRGHRLTCVSTGSAALATLAETRPDLIILDHVLEAGEKGLEFLPRLKAAAAHVPVILISGTLRIREQLAALQGPRAAHYFLEKPVDLDELDRIVETDTGIPHPQAPGPRRAARGKPLPAGARIDRGTIGRDDGIGQFTAGAGTGEYAPRRLQPFQRSRISAGATTLPDHLAVPGKTAGLQRAQDFVGSRPGATRGVDILHAQQPFATPRPGFQERTDRRHQRPEMQGAGGRRREATAINRSRGIHRAE